MYLLIRISTITISSINFYPLKNILLVFAIKQSNKWNVSFKIFRFIFIHAAFVRY